MVISTSYVTFLFFLIVSPSVYHVQSRTIELTETTHTRKDENSKSDVYDVNDNGVIYETIEYYESEEDSEEPEKEVLPMNLIIDVEKSLGQPNPVLQESLDPINIALTLIDDKEDDILKVAPDVAGRLKDIFADIDNLFTGKFPSLSDFVGALNKLKTLFADILSIDLDLSAENVDVLKLLRTLLKRAVRAIDVVTGALSALTVEVNPSQIVESKGPLIIKKILGHDIPALQLLLEPVNLVLNTILDLGEGVVTQLTASRPQLAIDFKNIFDEIRALLGTELSSGTGLADLLDELVKIFNRLLKLVNDLPPEQEEFASLIKLQVGPAKIAIQSLNLGLRALNGLTGLVSDALGGLLQGVGGVLQGATNLVGGALNGVGNLLGGTLQGAGTAAGGGNIIGDTLHGAGNLVGGALQGAGNFIGGLFGGGANTATTKKEGGGFIFSR